MLPCYSCSFFCGTLPESTATAALFLCPKYRRFYSFLYYDRSVLCTDRQKKTAERRQLSLAHELDIKERRTKQEIGVLAYMAREGT